MNNNSQIRDIYITPKHTNARTQYYDMSEEDTAWMYHWLIAWLADMTELATHNPQVLKEFFKQTHTHLPRGRLGKNSMASMIAGIISAKMHNPEHNISEPQLPAIEQAFECMSTYYADIPHAPSPIRFRVKLFD